MSTPTGADIGDGARGRRNRSTVSHDRSQIFGIVMHFKNHQNHLDSVMCDPYSESPFRPEAESA